MVDEYPKIRNVEPLPIMAEGRQMIALRDPHNLSGRDEFVLMTPQTFVIVTMFDGTNSIGDIQAFLMRMTGGTLVPREDIEGIVQMLDANFLLDNERVAEILRAYHQEPLRKSILAGQSFPDDPRNLEPFLDGIVATGTKNPAQAIICPHIDIHRGQRCYGDAYASLLDENNIDLFVIFGTAHYAAPHTRFVFTEKAYDTPYGALAVDKEFVAAVAKKTSRDLFADEIVHKGEHSIEFQALFLQHVIGRRKDIRIVPILVGSFHDCLTERRSPAETDGIEDVLEAIRSTAEEFGKNRVCYIAGADLAHVGQRFGDEEVPNEEMLAEIRRADMEFLDDALRVDREKLFADLAVHCNRYRICGFSPIYSLLAMIENENLQARLCRYEQSPEEKTGSVVTFGTLQFAPSVV